MISCCIVSYGTVDQYSDLGAAAFSFHMELFCIEQVVYGCLLSLCATYLLFWLELKIESQPLMLLILKAFQEIHVFVSLIWSIYYNAQNATNR